MPGLLDVPDFGGKKVVKIAAGYGFSGVVLDDGTIKTWGCGPRLPAGEPTFDGLTPATKVVDLSLGAFTGSGRRGDRGRRRARLGIEHPRERRSPRR